MGTILDRHLKRISDSCGTGWSSSVSENYENLFVLNGSQYATSAQGSSWDNMTLFDKMVLHYNRCKYLMILKMIRNREQYETVMWKMKKAECFCVC